MMRFSDVHRPYSAVLVLLFAKKDIIQRSQTDFYLIINHLLVCKKCGTAFVIRW
jgi:hypothetical protein